MTDFFMNVYVGQTRARRWIQRLESYGWGEMCCRGELPARRAPWAYDNGAFKDWTAKRAFDEAAFLRDLDFLHLHTNVLPRFAVLPDVVAGGLASLEFSLSWRTRLKGVGCPLYLAVQDGMNCTDVAQDMAGVGGLFVGGSLRWKIRTARRWVSFGHALGLPVHVGRVGTERRVRWAKRIGVDSIDSCLPLWSEENLARFVRGLGFDPQGELFEEVPA